MKRYLLPFLLCALLSAGPLAANAKAGVLDGVKAAHDRAKLAIAGHDYGAARLDYLDMLLQLHALAPNIRKLGADVEVATYMELGAADIQLQHPYDAIEDFRQAVALGMGVEPKKPKGSIRDSLAQLQQLYFLTGDCAHATEAARTELDFVKDDSDMPWAKVLPLTTIAKCEDEQGQLQSAKADFDALWRMTDSLPYIPPAMMRDLTGSSVSVYKKLQLDQLATDTQSHAEVLNRRYQAAMADKFIDLTPPNAPKPTLADVHGDIPPAVIDRGAPTCRPHYPHESVIQDEQGSVKVRIKVGSEGQLLDIKVVESSGHSLLDQATIDLFRNCRFKPGTHEGQPIDKEFDAVYKWKIEE